MEEELKKRLESDASGLLTYEYIANNINNAGFGDEVDWLTDNIINVDKTGQFVVSTARYLNAIDSNRFADSIDRLVKAAIARDREHVYLADLAVSLWGPDFREKAAQLCETDDNFRRIFKRLYPVGI